MASPSLYERYFDFYLSAMLYTLSAWWILKTILKWLVTRPTDIVFRWDELRSKAFGEFWISTQGADPRLGPLKAYIPIVESATGVILDVGPGDGRQVQFFTNPGVKAIYGAEPCVPLHKELAKAAAAAGLENKYHILACGGERQTLRPKLKEAGLLESEEKGVFDTIVCLKVLCGVPNQEDTVAYLYELLKPGGRLIVLEHEKNPWRTKKGSLFSRILQRAFMIAGWEFFMAGCVLDRDTFNVLKRAADRDGGWYNVDVSRIGEWAIVTWIVGEFVKQP